MMPVFLIAGAALVAADVAMADLDVSERWVDFDEVELDDSVSEEITLTNEGEEILTGLDIDLDGDGAFDFSHDCSDELAPGESCSVEIEFTPEEPGQFEATLEIDFDQDSATVDIEGTGVRE